jgi:hypothetical protein
MCCLCIVYKKQKKKYRFKKLYHGKK